MVTVLKYLHVVNSFRNKGISGQGNKSQIEENSSSVLTSAPTPVSLLVLTSHLTCNPMVIRGTRQDIISSITTSLTSGEKRRIWGCSQEGRPPAP